MMMTDRIARIEEQTILNVLLLATNKGRYNLIYLKDHMHFVHCAIIILYSKMFVLTGIKVLNRSCLLPFF